MLTFFGRLFLNWQFGVEWDDWLSKLLTGIILIFVPRFLGSNVGFK